MTMNFKVHLAKDVGTTVAEAVAHCRNPIMEAKLDGWRCIVIRSEDRVDVYNRSQKCYTGQLPELEADLMKLPVGTILDGELVAMEFDPETGCVVNDFFRLHSVMRSKQTIPTQRVGIKLVAFDCIAYADKSDVHADTLPRRRDWLNRAIGKANLTMVEMIMQMEPTQENHDSLVRIGFEGTIIKDQDCPYAFGKRGHGMFKIKQTRTIDTVVMEILMDGKGQHEGKAGRMVVGQYKDRILTRVATVNCLNEAQRIEATVAPARFVGKVLEVKHYGWLEGEAGPRHPTPMRFRDDKPVEACVFSDR